MDKYRTVILLALTSIIAYGQPSPKPESELKLFLGVKAGLNVSNISSGHANLKFTPGLKPDFHAGIIFNANYCTREFGKEEFTAHFGLQPELQYSRQGFNTGKTAITFNYIALPVMVKVYVARFLYLEAGPFFGYLFSVSPETAVISDIKINLTDLKGGMDVGAAAGAGCDFKNGMTVGARFHYGLSDMAGNLLWKNYYVAVSLGWKLNIK